MAHGSEPPSDPLFLRVYDERSSSTSQGIGCGALALLMLVLSVQSCMRGEVGTGFLGGLFAWVFFLGFYRMWLGFSRRAVHWLGVTATHVGWVEFAMSSDGRLVRRSEQLAASDVLTLELDDPHDSGAGYYVGTPRGRLALPGHLLRERSDTDAFAEAVRAMAPHVSVTKRY